MKLYVHQHNIIKNDPTKCGLFLGTGSGKTKIALALAKGDTLIIAPKTQVEDRNWEREYRKIVEEEVQQYEKGDVIPLFKPRITVISKEEFRRDFLGLPRFNTVIVDEAHTCLGVTPNVRWRNKQPIPKASQLFEALEYYITHQKPDRLYLCTATIIRSPMTVWAAGKLLGKTWDWYKFRDRFFVRLPMPGREVFRPKSDEASKKRLGELVREIGFTGQLTDYFDVPEQTYHTVFVNLTKEQKEVLKTLPLDFPDPLVLTGKQHQVENGVLSGTEFEDGQEFKNEKLDKILDYASEFPKMIVFAKYRAQIELYRREIEKTGKKVFVLTGDTKDRGTLIKEANETDEYVFIAQAQISAGWELPDCPVMVFASMDWSVVSYIQGQGRILRLNKLKKNLYIHLVVKDSVDNDVYDSIMNKQDFNLAIYENKRYGWQENRKNKSN